MTKTALVVPAVDDPKVYSKESKDNMINSKPSKPKDHTTQNDIKAKARLGFFNEMSQLLDKYDEVIKEEIAKEKDAVESLLKTLQSIP